MDYLKPRKALNKAFLKVKPIRSEMELFKGNLTRLLDQIVENESEEFHKNLVSDFLKSSGFAPDYFINTKGRNDLVIHNGKKSDSPAGVLIETKHPRNRNEMISREKLNAKALHEILLYFLRERITHQNHKVKHIVVTDIYEWFIFDARVFEQAFVKNKALVKEFKEFEAGRLSGTTTDFFYREIAQPAVAAAIDELEFTWFDFRDYEKALRNDDKKDDRKLIALFKLLSPQHLLKLPFANDSNSLDKKFYAELLHLIGLTQTEQKGKKLIERKPEKERDKGSLLENAITQIEAVGISRHLNPRQFGETHDEQVFNIALELVITWVNRILFLKLLEAQLLRYHRDDPEYAFLHIGRIGDYDQLNKLFFQVLARTPDERSEEVRKTFDKVPYLNSSLFDPTLLEQDQLYVSQLEDERAIPIIGNTVLKDRKGKRRSGELNALEYLFDFLNAYDFSSEGSEDIQEDNKSLINASVLGLIFEKINGYKDGSFFTPGFITMYMCRETIRRAVVQKFNEAKGWNCVDLVQLYNNLNSAEYKSDNAIFNSIRICDPAVGSGHFLVSALNELIAVKHELGLLRDRDGKRLRDYTVAIDNDELSITDEEGRFFEYRPNNKESQRVQETLFHEKQVLIENCLFGVDINPNSVKICRLRLWIELLKNAYYRSDTDQLETLPNIDINIKCGNSIVSRFPLDADLKKALRKSKYDITSYRAAVQTYREARSKDVKRNMEALIAEIKSDFRTEIGENDPKQRRLDRLGAELFEKYQSQQLFDQKLTAKQKAARKKLEEKINKLAAEIEEIKSNKIYENAFEWRFEFPEVLNEDGDYEGFDVVIGNPPYIRQEELGDIKPYLKENYATAAGTADLYVYFVERGMNVLRADGQFCYILPNKWMRAGYGENLRRFVKDKRIRGVVDFGDLPVFEEATTYPCIMHLEKAGPVETFPAVEIKSLEMPNGLAAVVDAQRFDVLTGELRDEGWTLMDSRTQKLLAKIRSKGVPLKEYVDGKIYRGVLTGLNEAFVIDAETKDRLIAEDPRSAEIIKPFLAGRDIKRYKQPESSKFLILFKSGDTKGWFGNDISEERAEAAMTEKYPAVMNWLLQFKAKAKKRYDKGQFWWELRACDYYGEFEKEKILYQEIASYSRFALDSEGMFPNNKIFMIPKGESTLLAYLNSKLVWFYLKCTSNILRGALALQSPYIFSIRVPEELLKEDNFQELCKGLNFRSDKELGKVDSEINELIYQWFELSEEDKLLVATER